MRDERKIPSCCCPRQQMRFLPGCNLGRSITRAVMRSNARAHCVLMTPRLSHRQTQSFQPWTLAGPRAAGSRHLTFSKTAPFHHIPNHNHGLSAGPSVADISIGRWWKTVVIFTGWILKLTMFIIYFHTILIPGHYVAIHCHGPSCLIQTHKVPFSVWMRCTTL